MDASQQYIEIGMNHEKYGIKLECIHEIIRMQDITYVPNSRPYLLGVINLRGSVVPVVSLRSRFAMDEAEPDKTTRIVVVHMNELLVGLVVDVVLQVIALKEIQPPPEKLGSLDGRFIMGVGQADGELIGILRMNQILETG